MVKFIVAALWICAATVGAVFYSFQTTATQQSGEPPKPFFGGLESITSDVMTVPFVHNSKVEGYFLTKLVYTVESAKLAKLSVPTSALITDEVYSYLYANPQIDIADKSTIDLDDFRKNIRDKINARVGTDLISEVLVDQIDFLSKADIRDNAIRRRTRPSEKTPSESSASAEH